MGDPDRGPADAGEIVAAEPRRDPCVALGLVQGSVAQQSPHDPVSPGDLLAGLSAQGRAAASVAIPNVPALIGIAFYGSFITSSPGIAVYNPAKVTIQ